LTFVPLPDTTRSCRSPARPSHSLLPRGRSSWTTRTFELPLLGLSKDRPSAVHPFRSPLQDPPATGVALESLGVSVPPPTRVPPSRFPSASAVSSFGTARAFAARCRPWGSPRFHPRRPARLSTLGSTRLPRDALLPFEAVSPHSGDRPSLVSRGDTSPRRPVTRSRVHRIPCPFAVSVLAGGGGSLRPHRPDRFRGGPANPAPVPSRRRASHPIREVPFPIRGVVRP